MLQVDQQTAIKLWFYCQRMEQGRKSRELTPSSFLDFLNQVGGLQLDSINVVDRAHYLTLWSRFGVYDRQQLDKWIYEERAAYEYWGHEASLLPINHLPLGRRRMKRFPPQSWRNSAWWDKYQTSAGSKRRVLQRLLNEGALETVHFEKTSRDRKHEKEYGPTMPVMPTSKEDKRSLELLWHAGKTAVSNRRYFRRVYDLAERVYPESEIASPTQYEDSWLMIGIKGNGIASERHLNNYFTAPKLKAPERKQVIERNLKKKRIVEVEIPGQKGPHYMLPEYIDILGNLEHPEGTTIVCPFDSLLWQRSRAEEWLDFRYRIEIYTPQKKREYGYYVMPILHNGRFVGRLDPKLHRDEQKLEIKALFLEDDNLRTPELVRELREALHDLSQFLGANRLEVPSAWSELE